MDIEENAAFAHSYAYKLLYERPGVPTLTYFYPGARTDSGRDGLLVRFVPVDTRPWIGVFAPLDMAYFPNGVYTHPDPRYVCVVSGGAGYIVCVHDPTRYTVVRAEPITEVRLVLTHRLLVFTALIDLAAYGARGFVWRTGRLALDVVHITEIDQSHIHGRANRFDGYDVDFSVDLNTGTANVLHPW